MGIANEKCASDVPAAGRIPASPQNADARREQPPTKWQTGRESLSRGAVEITTAHNCWEASDQRRGTNAALTSGVCVSRDRSTPKRVTVVPPFKAGSPLRRFDGACTIELAYQAAEANHPDEGREGSPLNIDTSPAWTGLSGVARHSRGWLHPRKRWQIRSDQTPESAVTDFGESEGLSVSTRCLAPESHHIKWHHSPWGSSRQGIVEGRRMP